MEQYVIEQIKYGLRYVPSNLIRGSFMKKTAADADAFRKKAGGTILGVCHPDDNFKQISDAHIGWVRFDISFPYEKDGRISGSYSSFKEKCARYKENGFKIMAVTPYPNQFISAGIDPVKQLEKVCAVTKFLIEDLRGLIDAVQITNEMGIPRFTIPLSMDEAARFIGAQAEAISAVKGDLLVGYNSAGPQADLHCKMKPYLKYFDYVGIDIYIGCFANVGGFMWFFDAMLKYLRSFTGKPILLQEFGYIGSGKAKTPQEKKEVLMRYGVSSPKEAKNNISAFTERLPEGIRKYAMLVCPDESRRWEFFFKSEFSNHLFCELPKRTKIPGYEHTPEGQAKFFADIIPRFYKKMPFLCGEFIYCYADGERCYVCSQEDCPTETKWGLVDVNGKEKPAYYAVQKAFGDIKKDEGTL